MEHQIHHHSLVRLFEQFIQIHLAQNDRHIDSQIQPYILKHLTPLNSYVVNDPLKLLYREKEHIDYDLKVLIKEVTIHFRFITHILFNEVK